MGQEQTKQTSIVTARDGETSSIQPHEIKQTEQTSSDTGGLKHSIPPTSGTQQVNVVTVRDVNGVRVIPVQALEEVKSQPGRLRRTPEEKWKRKKCQHWGPNGCGCNVLTYMENCEAKIDNHQNSVFGAFLQAYNTHQDILLAPDDMWLLICLHFSKYVNANSDALRSRLVSHEGKKKLTVTTWNEQSESEWTEFLTLMKAEIAKNTTGEIVNVLSSDFSTTGLVERLISVACVMDSFKSFFSYGRCIPCCGIRQACFLGTLQDWQSVLSRTDTLIQYDVDGKWTTYIEGMRVILRQFIETYQGRVDVDWWNRIMNVEHGRLGSGSTSLVSGWVLNLFGQEGKVDIGDIVDYSISVPVQIDNKQTGEKKTVHMIGGFGAVHSTQMDGRLAFRPQTSLVVYHDPTEGTAAAEAHFS